MHLKQVKVIWVGVVDFFFFRFADLFKSVFFLFGEEERGEFLLQTRHVDVICDISQFIVRNKPRLNGE